MADLVVVILHIILKGFQIVCFNLRKHLCDHLLLHQCAVFRLLRCLNRRTKGSHHGTHIAIFRIDGQRIIRQGISLNFVDVFLKARGQ